MTPKLLVRNAAADTTEIILYGPIGNSFWEDGVSAKEFQAAVKGAGKAISLRVNSPGGSVHEANAMVAVLDDYRAKKKGRVEVDVDGLAASAASYLAAAGDRVRVAANGLMMVHNPHAMTMGDAEDLRREADLLDKVKELLLNTYLRRAKLTREQMAAALDAETWYTGQEAVEAGLADEAVAPVSVAAFAGMEPVLLKLGYRKAPPLPGDAEAWAETRKRQDLLAQLLKGA